MKVAAIGAHPDDIELGAGASIAVHRNRGDTVRFIILTKGGKVAERDQREAEARRAAEILNVDDVQFLDYEDTRVPYDQSTVDELEAKLAEIGPDRVYIHAEEDTHQDHRRAAKASITASRNVNQVLAFEAPSTRSSFAPQYYNSVPEGVIEGKIEAIRSHTSQQEKKYLEAEAMKGLARFRGRQANSTYAEAFQVIRINNMYKSNFHGHN
ncbi:PIG-L deacetylase family protein [Haloarcula onubensis]|uniref:PIG-L family deacetylase n=1 Tax=Haloarcula onubensis TaxID=2950539 RepID=A0ABU2FLF7_9EURY|nr:PIG-L deacetylase family protein [Halomicroarcula sp. S3CR25-11]MDS0281593.1 PIG-L family deacetylase [Halomicroarcula sp. S3CR25-11]